MNDPDTVPAPVLDWPAPPQSKWNRERLAFLQLLPQLLEAYRDKYVAIHEGKVVDSGEELVPLATRVYAHHGYVPIYMDLVTERPLPLVRIPHVLLGRDVINAYRLVLDGPQLALDLD